MPDVTDAEIAEALQQVAAERDAGKTFCRSEAARRLFDD